MLKINHLSYYYSADFNHAFMDKFNYIFKMYVIKCAYFSAMQPKIHLNQSAHNKN